MVVINVVIDGIKHGIECTSNYTFNWDCKQYLEKRAKAGLPVSFQGVTPSTIADQLDKQVRSGANPVMKTDLNRLLGVVDDEQPSIPIFNTIEYLGKLATTGNITKPPELEDDAFNMGDY